MAVGGLWLTVDRFTPDCVHVHAWVPVWVCMSVRACVFVCMCVCVLGARGGQEWDGARLGRRPIVRMPVVHKGTFRGTCCVPACGSRPDVPWACLCVSVVPERCMCVLRSCVAVIRLDFWAGERPEVLGLGLEVGLLQMLERSWRAQQHIGDLSKTFDLLGHYVLPLTTSIHNVVADSLTTLRMIMVNHQSIHRFNITCSFMWWSFLKISFSI
jgi:hypothetical protein